MEYGRGQKCKLSNAGRGLADHVIFLSYIIQMSFSHYSFSRIWAMYVCEICCMRRRFFKKNVLVPQAFSQPHKKPHISSKSLQAANPIANAV